jgi:CheY-like chemotaxis protein
VGFRSTPGEGSEFWVDVPAHKSRSRSSRPPALRDVTADRFPGDAHRLILYVEDNPANVRFMKDLLSAFENIELLTAATAEAGIDLACTRHPEAIIMDINLPGMSGLEALRTLRAMPNAKDIPVIALTAAASERDRQRGIQAGFHRYITKPVKVEELLDVLEGLLRPQTGAGA